MIPGNVGCNTVVKISDESHYNEDTSSPMATLRGKSMTGNFTITVDGSYSIDDSGTATSGTTGVLNDTGKAWTANEHSGKILHITAGNNAGNYYVIDTNTATQLNIYASAWSSFNNTSQYQILDRTSVLHGAHSSTPTTLAQTCVVVDGVQAVRLRFFKIDYSQQGVTMTNGSEVKVYAIHITENNFWQCVYCENFSVIQMWGSLLKKSLTRSASPCLNIYGAVLNTSQFCAYLSTAGLGGSVISLFQQGSAIGIYRNTINGGGGGGTRPNGIFVTNNSDSYISLNEIQDCAIGILANNSSLAAGAATAGNSYTGNTTNYSGDAATYSITN